MHFSGISKFHSDLNIARKAERKLDWELDMGWFSVTRPMNEFYCSKRNGMTAAFTVLGQLHLKVYILLYKLLPYGSISPVPVQDYSLGLKQ